MWGQSKTDADDSFRELFRVYGPSLSRLAASYTLNSAERDDLLQEIAMAIWQALPRFRGESSEKTFLFRIAQNRAISHLTRRPPSEHELDEAIELPDDRHNPENVVSKEERMARLLKAIRRLPVQYRQVLTLSLEDLDYREIAEVLGISESNVGVRLNRARQLLRQTMGVLQ